MNPSLFRPKRLDELDIGGLDYYGSSRGNFANMYQYMTDQNTLDPTTFPDFEFKFYYRENSFWDMIVPEYILRDIVSQMPTR